MGKNKKAMAVVIVGIALTVLSLWGIQKKIIKKPKELTGSLYINGEIIEHANVIFAEDYIAIPLLQILKNIECNIQWIDSNSAKIVYKDSTYTLNINEISLLDSSGVNLIQPIYGGLMYRQAIADDIVLDYATLRIVLHHIDPQLYIDAESDSLRVIIEEKEENIGRTGDGSLS